MTTISPPTLLWIGCIGGTLAYTLHIELLCARDLDPGSNDSKYLRWARDFLGTTSGIALVWFGIELVRRFI